MLKKAEKDALKMPGRGTPNTLLAIWPQDQSDAAWAS